MEKKGFGPLTASLALAAALMGSWTVGLLDAPLAWAAAQFVSIQPGTSTVVLEQSCATSGTVNLVSAAQMSNTKRVTFHNNDGSNFVNICPGTAACIAGNGFKLTADQAVTVENAVGQHFTCLANSSAVVVEVIIERESNSPATPSPS